MIEEPVENASESRMNPKAGGCPEHDLFGKPRKMHGRNRCGGEEFEREIARRHRIQRIPHGRVEAELLRRHVAVDFVGRSGQRRRTERGFVQPPRRIQETPAVARRHFDIGQAMMPEGHRLGRLHMGEARHDGGSVALGLRQKRPLERVEPGIGPRAGLPHPEPQIGRHLIVARARRMQPSGRLADQFGEAGLHIHVDVLEFAPEGEAAFGDLVADGGEALPD